MSVAFDLEAALAPTCMETKVVWAGSLKFLVYCNGCLIGDLYDLQNGEWLVRIRVVHGDSHFWRPWTECRDNEEAVRRLRNHYLSHPEEFNSDFLQ